MTKLHHPVSMIIFTCVFAFLWPGHGLADINNLPWSTTFDCPEYDQAQDGWNNIDCDGIAHTGGDWYDGFGNGEQITLDANNPSGGGGRGQRHWFSASDGQTIPGSGALDIRMPSPQSEFWIRVYYRVQSGKNMSDLNSLKLFYLLLDGSTSGSGTYVDTTGDGEGIRLVGYGTQEAKGSTGPYDAYGGVSDGSWHAYEVYMNTATGVFRTWMYPNGVDNATPVIDQSGINYLGFTFDGVRLPSNSHLPGYDGYFDFDDIAISTTGRIGPLSGSGEPTVTVSDIFTESFDDNTFSSRGWFDDTSKTVDTSHKYSGAGSLKYTWAQSGTVPSNGLALRKEFTPTDELYLSFYIYFEDIYRGSQVNYHPHFIYILSDLDNPWGGLASNYLDTYVEFTSDIGNPYEIRPQIQLQDSLRVNTSLGNTPNNLTEITEDRSAMYCNGCKSGAECGTGDCFGSPRYSANYWRDTSIEIPKAQWVHYEVYFKMNTITSAVGQADGLMKLWINGKLSFNYSNIVYRTNQDATKKWATFVLAPYIGDGSPVTQSFWIDNLTLATSKPNSGDEGTAGAPSAPTGLTNISN
jgi:hypothetical protein